MIDYDYLDFAAEVESCIYLREANIAKVAQLTQYKEEDLRAFLRMARSHGKTIVRIPLTPRSLYE